MKISNKQGKEIATLINSMIVANHMLTKAVPLGEMKDYYQRWEASKHDAVTKLKAMNIPIIGY